MPTHHPRQLVFAAAMLLCGLVWLSIGTSDAAAQSASAPNIVYILADDMGLGDVRSYTSNSPVNTPFIDSLSTGGMRFTNAHSPSAVCTPTRYGVLTGEYAWRTRLTSSVIQSHEESLIDPDTVTVAEYLQGQGYATGAFGKWHLGIDWVTTDGQPAQAQGGNVDYSQPFGGGPLDHGFDEYFGDETINFPPYAFIEGNLVQGTPSVPGPGGAGNRPGLAVPGYAQVDSLPDVTGRAVQYIQEQAETDDPFFLYLPLSAPHSPIVPPDFIPNVGTNYDRFIATVDWSVGQVLGALSDAGITDDTLIIFTADNGVSKNFSTSDSISPGFIDGTPLRGQKADIHEAGHRVPFVVQWSGQIEAGAVSSEYVELNDLFATTVDLLGDELFAHQGVAGDSVSILPALLGLDYEGTLREAGVNHSHNGSFAVRQFDDAGNEWKLIFTGGSGGFTNPKGNPGDPTQPITNVSAMQLYNLTTDVGETTNLLADGVSPAEQVIMDELHALLAGYINDGHSVAHAIFGDINGDGFVGVEDLEILLANWGESGTSTQGDLNGDGVVGDADLQAVLDTWGSTDAFALSVPEPGGLATGAVAGVLLLGGRRNPLTRP